MPTPSASATEMSNRDREETASTQRVLEEGVKDEDTSVVTWDGPNDPDNPQNYTSSRKVFITFIWVYSNLATTIASSIWSSGTSAIEAQFHESTIVVTLGVSLFLLVSVHPAWSPSFQCDS